MQPAATAPSTRLYFLDWVRILAFFLLIVYHVGMYYVTWDWHVKSPHAGDAIEFAMTLSSPWRLALLFLVAGVASRLMLAKSAAAPFALRRSWRLLLPLAFGMLVIVPPQAFCEVIEKFAFSGSYGEFLHLYLHNYRGFATGPGHLVMPTWNHLWFVAYLWVYSMLLAGLYALGGRHWARWSHGAGGLLTGWRLLVLPAALLAVIRLTLLSGFPVTHALFDDWFNHAVYFSMFLFGAVVATEAGVWQSMDRLRFYALGMALAVWALFKVYASLPDELVPAATMAWLLPLQRLVYALGQWTAMVAACGFAHRHLNFDSAKREYLAEAVFPVYIVHQTLIVVMAHYLKPVRLSAGVEGVVLVVLTLCGSFAVVEGVRRVGVLRPLFGLGRVRREERLDAGRVASVRMVES
ncbi:MAG: hypothetical protein JWP59_3159 [Massilia sp.]|nr:hypothetical protein [Massilia sp.]